MESEYHYLDFHPQSLCSYVYKTTELICLVVQILKKYPISLNFLWHPSTVNYSIKDLLYNNIKIKSIFKTEQENEISEIRYMIILTCKRNVKFK